MKGSLFIVSVGLLAGCTCGNPHLNSSMSPVEIQQSIWENYAKGMTRDDVRAINTGLSIEQSGDEIVLWSSTCLAQLNWTSHGWVEFVYADDRLDHVIYALGFDAEGWDERVVDLDVQEPQP